MNTIGQLGISPAPWKCRVGDGGYRPYICDADGRFMLAYAEKRNSDANARLIAAAPDLYQALREAVVEMCRTCDGWHRDGDRCGEADDSCFVQRWRKALEKAGGKE